MIDVALIDYAKCHEYARLLCGQYGIPPCDAEDIGSDAFLLSIRRSWRTGEVENVIAAANRLMYTSVLNVIDRRNTQANKMIRQADSIDGGEWRPPHCGRSMSPVSEDDEVVDNSIVDAGRACRPATADPDDDWQNPFWLRLFRNERFRLYQEKKKKKLAKNTLRLIKEGLKDSRLRIVRDALKLSGDDFLRILDFFKERFDLCFQALRAWRAEN